MNKNLIFQKSSIAWKLFIPLMAVVVIQAFVFIGSISIVKTVDQLENNACTKLQDIVETRKNSLENQMINYSANPKIYKELVTECSKLYENSKKGIQELKMQDSLVDELLNVLHSSSSTGAFLFFRNGEGLYLRDSEPKAFTKNNSGILVEFGDAKIVKSYNFTLDGQWRPKADFENNSYSFYTKPIKAVYENEGGSIYDYGYWSPPFRLNELDIPIITYSIPLFDETRNVYAIAGIEITLEHLKTYLPYTELPQKRESTYTLLGWDEKIQNYKKYLSNGPYYDSIFSTPTLKSFEKKSGFDNLYELKTKRNYDVIVSAQNLKLYNTNTPFEAEEWILCGTVSSTKLLSPAIQLKRSITIAIIIVLAVGTLAAFFLSTFFARPFRLLIKALNQDKNNTQGILLPKVNIFEIDELSNAIEQMSAEQALTRQRIEYERDYDVLTNLINRKTFSLKVHSCIEKLGDNRGAMVMWDLDNLKYMNDTYGHDLGDRYIQAASSILGELRGYGGIVARRSGDEFFAFLYGPKSKEEYKDIIYQTHEKLSQTLFELPDGSTIKLRASAGVVWYPEDGTNYEDLIRRVDFAMYDVKHTFKGQIKGFSLDAFKDNQLLLEGREELNHIIDHKLIRYAFQPIYDIRTMKILGYEALIRPQSETIKSPASLIRIAREQGKLYQIERLTWMLALQAFQEQLQPDEKYLLFINSLPNISLSKEDTELIESKYADLLNLLVIEILEDEPATEKTLQKLEQFSKKWNCEIALDDFGTGYNSEVSLLHLQPSYLKIDMALIRDIHKDPNRQKMVANILSYANMRKIKVIAEGVEREDELLLLKNLKVNYAQGFFMAKPTFTLIRN